MEHDDPTGAAEAHTLRGHAHLGRGDVEGAMNAFLDALAADPGHVPAMLSRLELLALYREDHVAAVAAGRVMRERGVGGVVMASALGYSLAALDRSAEALTVVYEGLLCAPDAETLWYNAACLHARLGEAREVEVAIGVATELLPGNGAAARSDEDLRRFASEPWFVVATDPNRPPVHTEESLRELLKEWASKPD